MTRVPELMPSLSESSLPDTWALWGQGVWGGRCLDRGFPAPAAHHHQPGYVAFSRNSGSRSKEALYLAANEFYPRKPDYYIGFEGGGGAGRGQIYIGT